MAGNKKKGWGAIGFAFGPPPVNNTKTFEIVEDGFGSRMMKGIKCTQCGKTSWHQGDVENLYCASCKMFHEQ